MQVGAHQGSRTQGWVATRLALKGHIHTRPRPFLLPSALLCASTMSSHKGPEAAPYYSSILQATSAPPTCHGICLGSISARLYLEASPLKALQEALHLRMSPG